MFLNTFIILFSRFKEMKMNAIIKEVALYVFFVACLCIVSYSHRDPTSFAFRETMYNSFVAGVHGGKKNFLSVSGAGALAGVSGKGKVCIRAKWLIRPELIPVSVA